MAHTLELLIAGYGGMDIFVAKISPTGTWLNAYRATCNNNAYSYGIAVNSANDIVIVGAFMSQFSFGSQGGSSSGGTEHSWPYCLNQAIGAIFGHLALQAWKCL
jgi:hypothetical protein